MGDTTTQSEVRLVEVLPEYAGQRIDNFLLHSLKGVPKSRIYRIVRKGEVRVNRARIRPDYRLQLGDIIRIPPLRQRAEKPVSRPSRVLTGQLEQSILLEDNELLVVNKPAGLAVHAGSGIVCGLIEALRAMRPKAPFLELAHRLDRDTSGCLILAKTSAALRNVQQALQQRQADKRYLLLVRGRWGYGVREMTAALKKNVLRSGERIVVEADNGKSALTRFAPLSLFDRASLLEARIATGRTHQIRVHAALLDYPIAGDRKYGDKQFNRECLELGLNRLFLHAHSIDLQLRDRFLSVSAPLEPILRDVLDRLES